GDTIRPVVESRRPGDMLVRLNLGADGSVLSTEVLTWSVDLSGSGADGYRTAETAPGEGCSTAQSTCVFTNAETIQGGPWLSNDLSADGTSLLKPHTLLEFGVNVGNLVAASPLFSTVQVRTASDLASATTDTSASDTLEILTTTLPAVTCPGNLNSCTANDVTTSVVAVNIVGSDACNSPSDTINLQITTQFATTASQRYDVGVFVANDGGTVQEPSSALVCSGAAPQVGEGDINAYPDADTDLFLRLDCQRSDKWGER